MFTVPSGETWLLLKCPTHSPPLTYSNCPWYKSPPSWIDAVIEGAENESLLATILSISLFNLVTKSLGVSAIIYCLHSGSVCCGVPKFGSSQLPAFAAS